jgi:hypothetical protein
MGVPPSVPHIEENTTGPKVRRERGSLLRRRPPAHQFLLPERAQRNVPACFTPTYVIRCAIGEWYRACFGL